MRAVERGLSSRIRGSRESYGRCRESYRWYIDGSDGGGGGGSGGRIRSKKGEAIKYSSEIGG